mmetsp:Transcript_54986/g.139701  ORF Transcript_54986/g.139701 Transcript_54986/m.139701 type:complete len:234 (+) Transcript_54986:121-822(+)
MARVGVANHMGQEPAPRQDAYWRYVIKKGQQDHAYSVFNEPFPKASYAHLSTTSNDFQSRTWQVLHHARTAAAGNAVAECSFASAASPAGALLPARPHNRQPRRLWAYRGCRGERPPDDAEELTSEPRCRHDLRASPRSLAERWPNRGPGESPGTQPSPHTSACGARAADSRVLRGFRSSTVCCGRAVPDSSAVPSGCWTLLHEQRGPAHAKHQLGELRPGGPGGAAPAWLPS